MFLTEFKGYDLTKYNDFLIECSKKDYSNQKTHRHHILPRFMGGENKGNLIRINQQDHFDAHLILAFCFPDTVHYYHGNILSAHRLSTNIKIPDNFKELFSETQRITNYGRRHTEETKKKLSESKKGIPRERWIIERANAGKRGKKETPERCLQKSEQMKEQYSTGKRVVNFGDRNSEANISYRKKMSERGKNEQNGKDNKSARQIRHIESNRIFLCLKDAMNEFGIANYNCLYRRIKSGIFEFLDEQRILGNKNSNIIKSKQVLQVETGRIFNSKRETINTLGIRGYDGLNKLIREGKFKVLEK